MIERLKETGGAAFGFKVAGALSEEDLKAFEPQLEFFIAQHKKHPIGILADLTEMQRSRMEGSLGGPSVSAKAHRPYRPDGGCRGTSMGRDCGHSNRGSRRSAVRDALLRIL